MKVNSAYPASVGFKSRKAAHIAAFFSSKESNGIDKLKLIKLIYLAERDFISQYLFPMLYDEFYSFKDGPVCSNTLNGINGNIDKEIWAKFILLTGRKVAPVNRFERDDFDEISDAELEVLEAVWTSFGWMSTTQIRDYVHKHCPEYTEISNGRIPISYNDVLKALGEENPDFLDDEIKSFRKAESILRV